ncbi:hypothetical protein DICPUDRAFT_149605 [Dictyostelium purpureum]|uniref:Uncharacterized protein n=1 Tax=Dictyostelium purpureum TaxID=5786 RepID=F0ZE85_DICPU|nr:uncharacterized protein DICPUDRAFT_149605 [Dictyostelium purpureum]EGC37758.1 hypothetical protein DICPUDRAFT_149605 [Dictyostelium purpureum]|eukprot:XP_003285697.1 hypothetical protein DICPUDRAFT_149605 [Dictyostelium purpureum]
MNSNKSVFWGFISLSVAGFGAWYIERTKYMEEKKKKIEEVAVARQKYSNQNNITQDEGEASYKPYDETNRKRENNTNK